MNSASIRHLNPCTQLFDSDSMLLLRGDKSSQKVFRLFLKVPTKDGAKNKAYSLYQGMMTESMCFISARIFLESKCFRNAPRTFSFEVFMLSKRVDMFFHGVFSPIGF